MTLPNNIKRYIPLPIRRLRWKAGAIWRSLAGPAPLIDFTDYDDYWDRRAPAGYHLRRWKIGADCLPNVGTLLDCGCGSGEFLEYLRSVRPDIEASGIDLSSRAVEMTRTAGFPAEVLDPSRQAFPLTYDYVTCFEVIEHIADAEAVLRHLKKAFRRRLIISIPNVGAMNCRLRLAVFGRFPLTRCIHHVKEHVRHWTPKDFREWLATEGLRVVEEHGDWGIAATPWKRWPALFARGLVYVIEHDKAD